MDKNLTITHHIHRISTKRHLSTTHAAYSALFGRFAVKGLSGHPTNLISLKPNQPYNGRIAACRTDFGPGSWDAYRAMIVSNCEESSGESRLKGLGGFNRHG